MGSKARQYRHKKAIKVKNHLRRLNKSENRGGRITKLRNKLSHNLEQNVIDREVSRPSPLPDIIIDNESNDWRETISVSAASNITNTNSTITSTTSDMNLVSVPASDPAANATTPISDPISYPKPFVPSQGSDPISYTYPIASTSISNLISNSSPIASTSSNELTTTSTGIEQALGTKYSLLEAREISGKHYNWRNNHGVLDIGSPNFSKGNLNIEMEFALKISGDEFEVLFNW